MSTTFEFEKRQFIRLPIAVPVRYKFLSREMRGEDMEAVHEGISQNVGAGGLLLRGKVPESSWLSPLLTHKMFIGVNIMLPNAERPVKALCRVMWSSAIESENGAVAMGLSFQEITSKDQDTITQYIIRAQMPG
jgi:hypothetical protein